MGMDSKKLSGRTRQPGHDRTFTESEINFIAALKQILPDDHFDVYDHPPELKKMFGGKYGIIPEAAVVCRRTQRRLYFEVKKQGASGNADERACKHHTTQFQRTLRRHLKADYHAFFTIFCDNLATDERYTTKHPYFFEEGQYFLWVDRTDLHQLRSWLLATCERLTCRGCASEK
jgi:hypothetical protein